MLLTALNAADYVTTRMLLARSGSEANPLAGALLGDGRLLWVKMGLLALFGIMVLGLRARLGILALAWFAAGLYATAVLSNVLLLRLT
ncbi:MAG TPA: DUF5658 family protein [Acidimicrobiales bacterium]|nr:DUF5658 family protein [Acidimicrobiales bacterium]